MNDNENKKNNEALPNEVRPDEALPDDALENVAGGGLVDWFKGLFDKDGNESSESLPTGKGGML